MCLIVVALDATPRYPLVVAANRDEQHARPTRAAGWWPDAPRVIGGRDLTAGGTWLALERGGRFAAVTNIRDPERRPGLRSRGALVAEFVTGSESAARYAAAAVAAGDVFGAFHLLVYDGDELYTASNRGGAARLGAGTHAFSNAPPGVEWPKATSARESVRHALAGPKLVERLFALLAERDDSGSVEQRYRRSHFVVGPMYGTRCSTVITVDAGRRATFAERSFDSAGKLVAKMHEAFALES